MLWTTSTQNSGLFEHILPLFAKKTGIEVRVVAVGTGQALKNAENGDGDVVSVHSITMLGQHAFPATLLATWSGIIPTGSGI